MILKKTMDAYKKRGGSSCYRI